MHVHNNKAPILNSSPGDFHVVNVKAISPDKPMRELPVASHPPITIHVVANGSWHVLYSLRTKKTLHLDLLPRLEACRGNGQSIPKA